MLEAPDQEQEAPAEFNAAVIAESTTQLRRRSVSQAVLDLDLSGAPVFVFRHASTGRVNVVYRRAIKISAGSIRRKASRLASSAGMNIASVTARTAVRRAVRWK